MAPQQQKRRPRWPQLAMVWISLAGTVAGAGFSVMTIALESAAAQREAQQLKRHVARGDAQSAVRLAVTLALLETVQRRHGRELSLLQQGYLHTLRRLRALATRRGEPRNPHSGRTRPMWQAPKP
jgi:hypothetical protein